MRPVIYVLSFIAVLGLGFWAYREHYDTREALRDVSDLNREIADLREALALQRAEWAYLNRPDRLRDLAALNFDRLGLLPLEPTQFGDASSVGNSYIFILFSLKSFNRRFLNTINSFLLIISDFAINGIILTLF